MASSPISFLTMSMAVAMVGAENVFSRMARSSLCYTWPMVRMRAFAKTSFCDMTDDMGRKRSMMERT